MLNTKTERIWMGFDSHLL